MASPGPGTKPLPIRSYGFWITALNKAGNYKRGKRSAFMPAMGALVDDHNPLTGELANFRRIYGRYKIQTYRQ